MRSLLISLTFFLSRAVAAGADTSLPSDQVDPDVAQGISIAVTAIAPLTLGAIGVSTKSAPLLGLGAIALIIGPSTGRWYAGESALPTMGLRLTGAVLMIGGLVGLSSSEGPECGGTAAQCASDEEHYQHSQDALEVAFFGGAALVVGTAIWDCAHARSDAEDANAATVHLVPTVTTHSAGLALTGTF